MPQDFLKQHRNPQLIGFGLFTSMATGFPLNTPIRSATPDAYGLGVGMDQFGRPVKPKPWQAQ